MSALHAGMIISVLAIVSMIVTGIVTPIAIKIGNTGFTFIGMILLALTTYLFTSISPDFSTFDYVWRIAIGGVGTGFTLVPIATKAILNVPFNNSGTASSMTNISRTIGSTVGVAILVATLNYQLDHQLSVAKNDIIAQVENSTLQQDVKEAFVTKVRSMNRKSKVASTGEENILNSLNEQEQTTLSTTPKELIPTVQTAFTKQKEILLQTYNMAQKKYTEATVTSFQTTFKYSSLFFLLGIMVSLINMGLSFRKIKISSKVHSH